MKDFAKTKEYRELRAALLASLEKRNLLNTTYRDKVNEYMDFWVRRRGPWSSGDRRAGPGQ